MSNFNTCRGETPRFLIANEILMLKQQKNREYKLYGEFNFLLKLIVFLLKQKKKVERSIC